MKTLALQDQFRSWLLSTYNDPEFSSKVHCFAVREKVALAPGEVLDFVSIRHDRIPGQEKRRAYSLGLWKFNIGSIDVDAINGICRQLLSFRSGCAEFVSRMEMKGEAGVDAVSVHANLVGACISFGAASPVIANGFGELSFWTYREGVNRIEVEPYYDDSAAARPPLRLFRDLLEAGDCSAPRRKARRPRALSPV